jgi:hypothetical protein
MQTRYCSAGARNSNGPGVRFLSTVSSIATNALYLGLGVGLPLIPFVLIASRTRVFDSVLPVLPVIFFCHTDPLHFTLPPSPQITLAVLPYIRSIYNALWQRYIAVHEARWIKETTPKFALENAEAQERQRQQREQRQQRRRAGRRGQEAPAAVEADLEVQQEWDGEVRLENHNIIVQGSNVTSTVLGALLWPSMAKLIGQSLGRLPASWGGDRIRKWLPTALARNVAGGLMVVVVKVCANFFLFLFFAAAVGVSCKETSNDRPFGLWTAERPYRTRGWNTLCEHPRDTT